MQLLVLFLTHVCVFSSRLEVEKEAFIPIIHTHNFKFAAISLR